ncbi:hypothetical protein F5I97DRAFT_1832264 [Phlebopus sp. FC_14]|nr:hypothetical protein F5I97DRAFT_1832264 [Phlebopus sp. FC_14]
MSSTEAPIFSVASLASTSMHYHRSPSAISSSSLTDGYGVSQQRDSIPMKGHPSTVDASLRSHRSTSTLVEPSHVVLQQVSSLQPATPEEMQRTTPNALVPRNVSPVSFKAGKLTDQLRRREIPEWEHVVHPTGALYFRRSRENMDILTHTDLGEKQNLYTINANVDMLLNAAKLRNICPRESTASDDQCPISLVLELSMTDNGSQICHYYFVDHEERLLFWLHDLPHDWIENVLCGGLRFVSEGSHIRYAVEAQYWLHCERYANKIRLKAEYIHELCETLIHANTDAVLTETSVVPFAPADLQKMLDIVRQIESHHSADSSHSMNVVARMLRLFAHSKFLNFCGLPYARLDSDQSLYLSSMRPRSLLFSPLNVVLLNAPSAHIDALQNIYVDNLLNASRWAVFINNLKEEWNGFSIYIRRYFILLIIKSTVMLAVDISFLAVPSGVNSTVTTAIYASTMAALAALVSSVLLLGQIRGRAIESVEEGAAYMSSTSGPLFGFELLAIMLSLPYAFLIWGMVAFWVALSVVVYTVTTGASRGITVTVWALVIIMLMLPLLLGTGRRRERGDKGAVKAW